MKKTILKGIVVSAAALNILAASLFTGCKYEGDNNYYTVANDEKKLDMAFTIDKFNTKENVILYKENDTTPYNKDGKDVTLTLYFPVSGGKEISDVPYVNFNSALKAINGSDLNVTKGNNTVTYEKTYNTGYTVTFDESKQTIDFLDFDEFIKDKNSVTILDYLSDDGRAYMSANEKTKTETHGKELIINLKNYGVPFKFENGEAIIPLQTFNDVFMGLDLKFVYNKKGLYYIGSLSSGYFDSDSGMDDRSEELIKLNYNELCLDCDLFYGLKSEHGISSFDDYFTNTGLSVLLKGYTDKNGNFVYAKAQDTVLGIYELTTCHFADYHSGLKKSSYYAGSSYVPKNDERLIRSPTYVSQWNLMTSYKNMRKNQNLSLHTSNAEVFDYQEYSSDGVTNDTAVLTYDSFAAPYMTKTDYFALTENGTKELSYDDVKDTFGLVIYAQQQIAANPDIGKVVVDLSCNGGGSADALIYICSWMLGDCTFNLKDTLTGALGSTVYTADVNLDGTKGGEGDSLSSLKDADGNARKIKIYCITSPMSFSCGNALPAMLKQSGKVTLLGKTSGGGSCVVRAGSAADTTVFQMSGNYEICTVKNGSFYQVDQGVVPDFAIDDFEKTVYNRENLAKYIASLN